MTEIPGPVPNLFNFSQNQEKVLTVSIAVRHLYKNYCNVPLKDVTLKFNLNVNRIHMERQY